MWFLLKIYNKTVNFCILNVYIHSLSIFRRKYQFITEKKQKGRSNDKETSFIHEIKYITWPLRALHRIQALITYELGLFFKEEHRGSFWCVCVHQCMCGCFLYNVWFSVVDQGVSPLSPLFLLFLLLFSFEVPLYRQRAWLRVRIGWGGLILTIGVWSNVSTWLASFHVYMCRGSPNYTLTCHQLWVGLI